MNGDTPVYMFFIKDHLGSVRAVVSETGEVLQTNEFYPYGDLFSSAGTADSNGNRYRFTGKELGNETGLYDFSARYLQTSLGRFTTIDPLAEKYPNISPYAYCNGNPVRYIDPDGRKIEFSNGVSDKFKEQYAEVVRFMVSKGTAGDLEKLEASDTVYYINEAKGEQQNQFKPKEKTIFWNPNEIVVTSDYINMSPATVLAHEAAHASEYDRVISSGDYNEMAQLSANKKYGSDPIYDTLEEKRVITGVEQVAARKHGEIRNDQVTRRDHKINSKTIPIYDNMTPEELSRSLFEYNDLF